MFVHASTCVCVLNPASRQHIAQDATEDAHLGAPTRKEASTWSKRAERSKTGGEDLVPFNGAELTGREDTTIVVLQPYRILHFPHLSLPSAPVR